jgi:hypothetical protein
MIFYLNTVARRTSFFTTSRAIIIIKYHSCDVIANYFNFSYRQANHHTDYNRISLFAKLGFETRVTRQRRLHKTVKQNVHETSTLATVESHKQHTIDRAASGIRARRPHIRKTQSLDQQRSLLCAQTPSPMAETASPQHQLTFRHPTKTGNAKYGNHTLAAHLPRWPHVVRKNWTDLTQL